MAVAQIGIAFATIGHAGNLVINGGFENGSTGWTITDPDGDGSTRVLCGNVAGAAGHGGNCYVWGGEVATNLDVATVTQTGIPVQAGVKYTLSFFLTNFPDTEQNPLNIVDNELDIRWNGIQIVEQMNIPITTQYTAYNLTVNGNDGDGTGTLQFQLNNPPGALLLDDVSLQPQSVPPPSNTPEPATLLPGLFTLLALAGFSLKRAGRST
jgi:hypothetical protein